MSAIDDRLAELSIELPDPPAPLGNYVGAHTVGNLVYLSGHGTNRPDGSFIVGKVPTVCSEEEAYQAARLVGLNLLATLKNHIGDLDRVQRVIKVLGMVNAEPDFGNHPSIINGLLRSHGRGVRRCRTSGPFGCRYELLADEYSG